MTNRFLPIQSQMVPDNEVWVIICDWVWYHQIEPEIKSWAKDCLDSYTVEGMIIKFANAEDCNVFFMRWANG